MTEMVVTTGLTKMRDLWNAATWFGDWGTGTTNPVLGNTGLETPAPEARDQSTDSTPAADKSQHVVEIAATAARAITEFGLFDALTAGVMVYRSVFAALNVVSTDTVEFTLTLTWS